MKKESGKSKKYKKNVRYSRGLKKIFKNATRAALSGKNDIREYFEYMLRNGYTQKDARNTITRYIATSVYGVMKNKADYKPYSWRAKAADIGKEVDKETSVSSEINNEAKYVMVKRKMKLAHI